MLAQVEGSRGQESHGLKDEESRSSNDLGNTMGYSSIQVEIVSFVHLVTRNQAQ